VRKAESSRYGAIFGSTVHRAIELVLAGCGTAAVCVGRAAREEGLTERMDEATADVERALTFARGLGRAELRSEYPVCVADEAGTMLVGFVDLLAVTDGEVTVIDFKSDAPPGASATLGAYPEYRRQLALYERALRATGLVGERQVRVGLLFTGSGEVVWG